MAVTKNPKFATGRLYIRSGADVTLREAGVNHFELVNRHVRGDYGDVTKQRQRQNDDNIRRGSAIISCYAIDGVGRFYVVTNSNETTVMTAEDFASIESEVSGGVSAR